MKEDTRFQQAQAQPAANDALCELEKNANDRSQILSKLQVPESAQRVQPAAARSAIRLAREGKRLIRDFHAS